MKTSSVKIEPHLLLLNIGKAEILGDWNWSKISSPFFRIYYVTEGEAWVRMPQGEFHLQQHRLYLIPAFTEHSCRCRGRFTHYYIHIYEDSLQGSVLENYELPFEQVPSPLDLPLIERLLKLHPNADLKYYNPVTYDNRHTLQGILDIIHNVTDLAERMETNAILNQLTARFIVGASERDEARDLRIQHAVNLINKCICAPLSVRQLAADLGLTPDHFIRLFRSEIDETPLQYIMRKKTERAQLLLTISNAPIKAIAANLGYTDTAYFIRLFHKHTGVSPTEYRKENK